jgi:hypothetical protein
MSNSTLLIIANILFGVALLLILFGVIYSRIKPAANDVLPSSEELASNPKPEFKCAKCSGEMELGYIPDYFGNSEYYIKQGLWVEGYPEKHWFGGVKVRSKKRRLFFAYCCSDCGYMESYAISE